MPLQRCTLKGSPGWQYGKSGTCYTFTEGDDASEKAAKKKAIAQAIAIGGGKVPPEGLAEAPERFPYRSAAIVLSEEVKDGDTVPMMLFPIGNWHSAIYPKLPLRLDLAQEVIANFEAKVQDRDVPVEASGRHDTAEPAVGWVKRLYLAHCRSDNFTGEALWCDWQPNSRGAMLLNEGAYRYNSVEIDEVTDNRTGSVTPNVLLSVCLTNVPVVRIMPPIDEASQALRLAEHCDGKCGKKFGTYAFEDEEPYEHTCGKRPFAEFFLGELQSSYNEADDNNNPAKQAGDTSKIAGQLLATPPDGNRSDPNTGVSDAGLAPTQGPAFSDLMAHLGAVHAALITKAAGKKGVGALRDQAKALCDQFTQLCDDSQGMATSEAKTDPATDGAIEKPADAAPTQTALRASEGTDGQGGRSPQKGGESHMALALKLKLAENASDVEIEAELDKMIAENTSTKTQLAEDTKAKHDDEVKVKLAEAVKAGEITAAEADTYGPATEKSDAERDGFLAGRKGVKAVKLSEQGGSEHREAGNKRVEMPEGDPSQQIHALAQIKAAELKCKLSEATVMVRRENPELNDAYRQWKKDPRSYRD